MKLTREEEALIIATVAEYKSKLSNACIGLRLELHLPTGRYIQESQNIRLVASTLDNQATQEISVYQFSTLQNRQKDMLRSVMLDVCLLCLSSTLRGLNV